VKRYARLFASYVLIALAVVLLYAPWGLALRPWDYDILRAGFSIIAGIALAGTFCACTYLALKDPDVKLLEPTKVKDVDEVAPLLEEYSEIPHVGAVASQALDQINSASRKKSRLRKTISVQFEKDSLTWHRFYDMVETAERTILRNSALVCNYIQAFDQEEYTKVSKANKRSEANAHTDEQLELYNNSIEKMKEIVSANDRILLEMAKLEFELSELDADDTRESAGETVEELQDLIEETRFYR
jgi:hypothetical protein